VTDLFARLDMEFAQDEDPDKFNPDIELRDYEEVARSLPVFCVSSRAYQKLRGRLQRDNDVPGFCSVEKTEIPQLQAHCKMLTESGRASNCRAYLSHLSQLLTSLGLWLSNDNTCKNLSDIELATETQFLETKLEALKKSLKKGVEDCLKDIKAEITKSIFDNYGQVIDLAVAESNNIVTKWHRPVNRVSFREFLNPYTYKHKDNWTLGGYGYSTYRGMPCVYFELVETVNLVIAIMRRDGWFINALGSHDFNAQL
jgi:hypothetical protein